MLNKPVIVWFRLNLRIADNLALHAAIETASPIIPLYILDESQDGWPLGGASRWWLSHSLKSLDDRLRRCGSRLVLKSGDAHEVLCHLAREWDAEAVCFTRGYEPEFVKGEVWLKAALKKISVGCHRYSGNLLTEPETIRNNSGEPYKIFTHFYKACLQKELIPPVISAPRSLKAPEVWPDSDTLEDWKLEPSKPDWAREIRNFWRPGEAGAQERLNIFVRKALVDYAENRDRPDLDGTSCLSPHLAFGEISVRQIWHTVSMSAKCEPKLGKGANAFIRELYWRDFSAHLLFHWPGLPEQPFRSEFARLPWKSDNCNLKRWQKGLTGYPIVDAGMRQLWTIGWMHNRVRMVAASLLTKHLLIPWQDGEAWFRDTLVDADLANNAANWQWVAGSGADAAPYFRIFNPTIQGKKFDPEGNYVRRWVPELANMPAKHIHAPREAPEGILRGAGVTLGVTYPLPIIEHQQGRARALAAFDAMKRAAGEG